MPIIDSSTGGILTPADTPAPAEDIDLELLFQRAVAQITGLAGNLVRPRWQPANPKQPEANVDWCAVAVLNSERDAGPWIQHNGAEPGTDTYVRHEQIEVLATFYGPHARRYVGVLSDGLAVPQNMEPLRVHAIAFVACGVARRIPELVNQTWRNRYDVVLVFRRKVTRTYAVRNLVEGDIHLIDDTRVDELITVPPAP